MKKRDLNDNVLHRFFRRLLLGGSMTMVFFSLSVHSLRAGTEEHSTLEAQQQRTSSITGVVKDVHGDPLIGVTVAVKGTTIGTNTDLDGKFRLDVPQNATLEFSYIGMIKQSVTVTNQKELNIVMQDDARALSEVIVTGVAAGTPKQKLGFSIEKVSAEKLAMVPATDAASALQGKVAGVRITKTSGAPGSDSDVQLRGVKMIYGSSNPLYIIDGIPTENGLADVNAEDIASIEVLKGAAASSLYGSRAANGVVSIITKRGASSGEGKIVVDYRSEFGKSFLGYIPKRSTSTNRKIENGEVKYGVTDPDQVYDNKYPQTYDHIDQFFNPGSYFTNHLAVKGTSSDGKLSVYTSIQSSNETGVVKMVDGANRTNVRLNLDYRIAKNLLFTTSNLFAITKKDKRADGVFGALFRADPAADLLAPNHDGTPYKVNANRVSDAQNPMYLIANSVNKSTDERLLSYFSLKYDPIQKLTLSTSYGTTRSIGDYYNMTPKRRYRHNLTLESGWMSRDKENNVEQAITADALYSDKVGDLNMKFKLQYFYESSNVSKLNSGGGALSLIGMDITSVDMSASKVGSSKIYKTIANNIAALAVLDYKDRYIFDGLIRRDGSSLFGKDVRWQTFYRLSGAWRISEDFKIGGIDEWKIRASYGVAGLRPPYEAQYESFALKNGVPGNMETLGNSNLKPAFSKEWELGMDIYFLDRFSFSANYSLGNNTDQILKVPISPLTGAAFKWQNAGTIQSHVWEASVNADVIKEKDMKLNLGLTFDKVRQKIKKLNCKPYMLDGTRLRIEEGLDFGILYLDKFARSLDEVKNQVPEGRTVDEMFAINNQGFVVERSKIGTINEQAIKVKDNKGNIVALPSKNLTPDFNLNLNATFTYKNFTLFMLWGYQHGGNVYNHSVRYTTEPALFDQSGKPWNEVKAYPYYSNGGQNAGLLGWDNDVLVFDATFLKLRELSLNYDFKVSQWDFIKNIKVSLIGRNLLSFTKYPGFDPEGVKANKEKGVDSNTLRVDSNDQYPLYRTLSGSIALTF